MNKMKILVIGLLMSFILPVMSNAEEMKYDIWIGGIQVTETNKNNVLGTEIPTVIFNSKTDTLTLNNAIIENDNNPKIDKTTTIGTDLESGEGSNKIFRWGITSKLDNLNIVIKGNNRIGKVIDYNEGVTSKYDYDYLYGIKADDGVLGTNTNLTFSGDGNLIIYDSLDGIKADNITFNEKFTGKFTIYDVQFGMDLPPCAISANNDVLIENGNFELISYNSNAIYGDKVFILDGYLKIKAYQYSNEIYTENELNISDDLKIINGEYQEDDKAINAIDKSNFVIIEPKYYTVKFELFDKSNDIESLKIKSGDKVQKPNEPTNKDYIFDGWYLDKNFNTLFDFDTKITQDVTLYAKWNLKDIDNNVDSEDIMENPKTNDYILLYLLIGIISICGIVMLKKYKLFINRD